MRRWLVQPEFLVERAPERCIQCQVCVRQCANDVHEYDAEDDLVSSESSRCVGRHRCATLCPTGAISIRQAELEFRPNANWTAPAIRNIYKQAEDGGVLLAGMGNDAKLPIYWDHMLLNASQVTNPPIDPLREPMELLTPLGRTPSSVEIGDDGEVVGEIPPQLELQIPVMFSAMSYGSISLNASISLARAAHDSGTYANTGEGGLHEQIAPFADNMIVQASLAGVGVCA